MHREYAIDDSYYGDCCSLSLEDMRRITRDLQKASLEMLKFQIWPPGFTEQEREELVREMDAAKGVDVVSKPTA